MPRIHAVAASTATATGVLTIAGAVLVPEGPPTATATAAQVAAYYSEHTATLQWSIACWSLAAVALIVFSAVASTLIQRAGQPPELAMTCGYGGVVAATINLVAQAPLAAGVREDFSAASATTRTSLYVVEEMTFCLGDLALPGAGLLVGALSVAAVRRTVLPHWFGYPGALIAIAAVLGALAPIHGETVGVFEILEVAAYILWPFWLVAAGLTLAVRGRSASRDATTTPVVADPRPASR
jgi:hypothetical protein